MTPALSRRAALSLPAFLAVPAAAVALPSPDAELLSLCQRYLSLNRRMDRLADGMFAAQAQGNKLRSDALLEAQRHFVPYGQTLMAEVMGRPALTNAGLRAKASVAMTRVDLSSDGTPLPDDEPLWSICQDLLAGGGPIA